MCKEKSLFGQIVSMEQLSAGMFKISITISANPIRVDELKLGMACELGYNIGKQP